MTFWKDKWVFRRRDGSYVSFVTMYEAPYLEHNLYLCLPGVFLAGEPEAGELVV